MPPRRRIVASGLASIQAAHLRVSASSRRRGSLESRLRALTWLAGSEVDAIVDNGAATVVPLVNYLMITQTPALFAEQGHELVIHTVVTGGPALVDTVSGCSLLISQFPDSAAFVVWRNPYWAPIESDGKPFWQFKGYLEHRAAVTAAVHQELGRLQSAVGQLRALLLVQLSLSLLPFTAACLALMA